MTGTTTAALCPVDVMNRAYGSRTAPGTLEPETIRKRHQHGQVFTPYHVSKEAAATLDLKANATGTIHILDAGAGDGQLTLATLDRIGREPEATRPRQIYLTAVEADTELADAYEKNLTDIEAWCKDRHMNVRAAVVREDFLSPRRWRCRSVNVNAHIPIDACIMNPPYRRTRNADPETRTIRLAGAATSANLPHLVKGKQVGVVGELRTRTWEHEGRRHYRTEVHTTKVELMSRTPARATATDGTDTAETEATGADTAETPEPTTGDDGDETGAPT